MIDLKDILTKYKERFVQQWPKEMFKWQAVKCFQDHWDVEASEFAAMLESALKKTDKLLVNPNNFPARMIIGFAKKAPDEVRAMFRDLFDESRDVVTRILEFKARSSILLEKYGGGARNHYQNENAVSTYLWLRYPQKYYIYKFEVVRDVAKTLGSDLRIKKGAYIDNLRNCFVLYEEIRSELKKDDGLKNLLKGQLTDDCYADEELCTLTIDVGFYIGTDYQNEKRGELPEETQPIQPAPEEKACNYWFLNANPKIWSFSALPVGSVQSYTLYNENGHKRRIFQNFLDAKTGDMVIGYESTPVKKIVAIGRVSAEQDGEKLCFEKTEGLASPVALETFKECPELANMEYLVSSQGSLFKLTKEEYDFLMDMIREENPLTVANNVKKYDKEAFLQQVYMTEDKYDDLVSVLEHKKNIVLQGAPGVGKTYAARRLAYARMGEADEERVAFVQFHQNYTYEDFMMGYKPVNNGFELQYGVFYRFCQKAANQPDKDFFFIIDEINRGNMSKIFGELLMLIEQDYRETKAIMPYNGMPFSVPKNLYIIGMMNTADRSLAMIDYALRRRFSFFEFEPGFESEGFKKYQEGLNNEKFNQLIQMIVELNGEIAGDKSLGKGFCIGHSYFCGQKECTEKWMKAVVEYDILPMLREYWFDDESKVQTWENKLRGVVR